MCCQKGIRKKYYIYIVLMKCNNSSWQLVELPYRIAYMRLYKRMRYDTHQRVSIVECVLGTNACKYTNARGRNTHTHKFIRGVVLLKNVFMKCSERERDKLEYIFNGRITTQYI